MFSGFADIFSSVIPSYPCSHHRQGYDGTAGVPVGSERDLAEEYRKEEQLQSSTVRSFAAPCAPCFVKSMRAVSTRERKAARTCTSSLETANPLFRFDFASTTSELLAAPLQHDHTLHEHPCPSPTHSTPRISRSSTLLSSSRNCSHTRYTAQGTLTTTRGAPKLSQTRPQPSPDPSTRVSRR
jgi:hypothetical protein